MELKTEDLTAAQEGRHVQIQANGHTFYLLSQQAYGRLEEVDWDVMSQEEMDLIRSCQLLARNSPPRCRLLN